MSHPPTRPPPYPSSSSSRPPPPGLSPPASTADALRICEEVQLMIEINTDHLERLRAPMREITTTSELTKQEIRTLEGKLIKLFSKQLAVRAGVQGQLAAFQKYPSLSQWLRVVGVSPESKRAIESRVLSLDSLLNSREKTDSELHRLLISANSRLSTTQRNEDLRRLSRALQSLKKYSDAMLHGGAAGGGGGMGSGVSATSSLSATDTSKLELHWDSWNHHQASGSGSECSSPRPEQQSPHPSTHAVAVGGAKVGSWGDGGGGMCSKLPHKPDSVASSLSSNSSMASSLPPPSPGLTLSPPILPWGSERKSTPPTTPPWSAAAAIFGKNQSQKFPTTPPPNKKHSTAFTASSVSAKSDYPLTKSKSHECELGNRIYPHGGSSSSTTSASVTFSSSSSSAATTVSMSSTSCIEAMTISEEDQHFAKERVPFQGGRRKRLPTEPTLLVDEGIDPGPSPVASPSPFDASAVDSGSSSSSSLQVPKSPRTPRSMGHAIRHRFKKTLKPGRCDHCSEYMFNGLKCKECKFKCHRDCEVKVPPSCCLPEDLVNYYVKQMTKENSPILPHMRSTTVSYGGDPSLRIGTNASLHHVPPYPDSSSNTSSCNSSTPSSPAVVVTSTQPTPPHSASIYHKGTKFTFPEPPITLKLHDQPIPQQRVTSPNPIIDSVKSYDSDKTLSGTSGSSGSAGTAYRLDSQDSTASVDDASSTWTAGRQTSISLREWDIPYEDLIIGDKIGSGRFSTVHQGNWHGDVAIKILNMENTDDDATLEAFRLDVSTFRKTRHENLILFMGACMNPPKLAIVTSLCKGNTLYTLLHLRKDKFPLNKLIIIAQQIAQGMGYLHHRGIVHKDLKTKNIFLENGHAIIADFGLVNVARRLCAHHAMGETAASLQQRESMSIPKGWLCYLAPEIMRSLRVRPDEGEDLPFTKASDVFAFGTVWYELLTGEWPWKHVPPETIIWLVGKGMEPSLANLQASKDVKDILLMCWTYKAEHRPDFTYLSEMLDKIPKKRGLIRSPSHPVHLWRSAESVF